MGKANKIVELAQELADERPAFFETKGPGRGDRDTASFMQELQQRAKTTLGVDYSEQTISGDNNLRVDFYVPEEKTIVEVALGLRNPLSEYERDILKALMAKEAGNPVTRLIFVSKPGAKKRCRQPGANAIAAWAERNHDVRIEVRELKNHHAA